MTHLTLSLLGPLHMTLDGQPANGFAYNKARALLAFLAVESHRDHSREALVGLLWPDLPEEARVATCARPCPACARRSATQPHPRPFCTSPVTASSSTQPATMPGRDSLHPTPGRL